ncbi:MAG: T9SS type A sorting domain-containing protein [Bacteroidia bacterium]
MIRSLLLSALFLLVSAFANAQHISWMQTVPVNNTFNGSMVGHRASIGGNHLYVSRFLNYITSYSPDLLGDYMIDQYDVQGNLIWSVPLSGKLAVHAMEADASGNVYIGGTYLETIYIGANDSLTNANGGLWENYFLISFGANGTMRYKRNLNLTYPQIQNISAIKVDQNSSVWFAMQLSLRHVFIKTDAIGNDVDSVHIDNSRLCESFSFDGSGNMYISGSTEQGTMNVNGTNVNIPETYMMFLTRLNTSGVCTWTRLGHDITFQSPHVQALSNGDVYFGGSLLDSTQWGSFNFPNPLFNANFFLTRVDSTGNFLWGKSVPSAAMPLGRFALADGNYFDADPNDNIYITGNTYGTIDWGNGVIITGGQTKNQCILSFDPSGVARWGITGGASAMNFVKDICVAGVDSGFLSANVSDTTAFDSIVSNQGLGQALMLAQFAAGTSTGVGALSTGDTRVYPNPFSTQIIISSDENAIATLLNISGAEILGTQIECGPSQIKIPETTAPGIYVLKIESAGKVSRYVLVKN